MACGTGKTFTSLKIAEKFVGRVVVVLFLVPSIALLNQTLLSWNADHDLSMNMIYFAVCSDSTVGRRENEDMSITDLVCPATTRSSEIMRIGDAISEDDKAKYMTVVFSTYQSLSVIISYNRGLTRRCG